MLPEAEPLFSAWFELSGDRQIAHGAGPIPFLAIDRFAARFGWDDPDEFALLCRAIRAMDSVYLEMVNRKTEP